MKVEEILEVEEVTEVEEPSETVDDEDVIEIPIDDEDLSGDAYYSDDFIETLTKAQCKKILDGREIKYTDKANLSVLRRLVIESNPALN